MLPLSSKRATRSILLALSAALGVGLATPSTRAQRTDPPAADLPIAVVMIGRTPRARWDAYAWTRGARALVPLHLSVDPGGSASSFAGSDTPALSPDGRWLAYFGGGRLRVRDLRAGTERVVPTTLDRAHAALIGGFAVDSSALLFFDMTLLEDADVGADEGGGGYYEGIHRVFALETGELRSVQLDDAHAEPALLESTSDLLVSERSSAGAALVRLHLGPEGVTRTTLVSSDDPSGPGQLAASRDELAWLGRAGIVVTDREGRNARRLPLAESSTENQWPAFAPSGTAMTFHHYLRSPTRGGGFAAIPVVTHLDRASGSSTELHPCRQLCRSGFEDDTHLLVLDGDRLFRVGTDRRESLLRTRVRAIAFASASL